jgi:hypothetical protein
MQVYILPICGCVCYEHKSESFICSYFQLFLKSDFLQINDLYVMQLWII